MASFFSSGVGAAWLSVCLSVGSSGCQRDQDPYKPKATPAASGDLDGMQLDSARRVALESATAALQQRNLERLKQLRLWVQKRAQVAILPAPELDALELGIQCLEHGASPDAVAKLDALEAGKLRKHARALCTKATSE